MKVKCIKNIINDEGAEEYITVEKYYTVYGILTSCWVDSKLPTYLIFDDRDKISLIEAYYFEIIDDRLSKYWKPQIGGSANRKYMYLLHRNWPDGEECLEYLEWLIDTLPPITESVFIKSKKDMDDEYIDKREVIYQDESLEYEAENLGDMWVLCPKCNEAWEVERYEGTISCPNASCNILLKNPYSPKVTPQ